MEDTTARCAPREYRDAAGLTGTEDTAGSEHLLVKTGTRWLERRIKGGYHSGESGAPSC